MCRSNTQRFFRALAVVMFLQLSWNACQEWNSRMFYIFIVFLCFLFWIELFTLGTAYPIWLSYQSCTGAKFSEMHCKLDYGQILLICGIRCSTAATHTPGVCYVGNTCREYPRQHYSYFCVQWLHDIGYNNACCFSSKINMYGLITIIIVIIMPVSTIVS